MQSKKLLIKEIELELDIKLTNQEARILLNSLFDKEDEDFTIDLCGNEYRFISECSIEDIYYEEQLELIKENYFDNKDLPWWIEIDWEKTIENVFNSDGYGHHFSTYDCSEENISFEDNSYYVFRTN
jgi:hypothetical protein